eukprot:SAG11_NODE_286_length_11220_cov_11.922399_8_plen_261_part_00
MLPLWRGPARESLDIVPLRIRSPRACLGAARRAEPCRAGRTRPRRCPSRSRPYAPVRRARKQRLCPPRSRWLTCGATPSAHAACPLGHACRSLRGASSRTRARPVSFAGAANMGVPESGRRTALSSVRRRPWRRRARRRRPARPENTISLHRERRRRRRRRRLGASGRRAASGAPRRRAPWAAACAARACRQGPEGTSAGGRARPSRRTSRRTACAAPAGRERGGCRGGGGGESKRSPATSAVGAQARNCRRIRNTQLYC